MNQTTQSKSSNKNKRDYAVVCLFHKDENQYLIEFVNYHLAIGFDRIYILDNGSTISPEATLRNYPKDVVVVDYYTSDRAVGKHARAFGYFIENYRHTAKWVAFIDTDEFIVLKKHDNIKDFLKKYEGCGGIAVNMLFFGDSGYIKKPEGWQIANFTNCAKPSHQGNRHIKTIGNMDAVENASRNPHWLIYKERYWAVNEHKERVDGATGNFTNQWIQLNHYWSRSYEEFYKKTLRGGGNGLERKMESFEKYQKVANATKDESILRFIPLLEKTHNFYNKYPLVIAVGLNKTGTTSLKEAFHRLGWKPLHHPYQFNQNVERALKQGLPPLYYLRKFNMFCDLFYPFPNYGHPFLRVEKRAQFVEWLIHNYRIPGIKFILNIRNRDSWLISRKNHVSRNRKNPNYKGLWTEFNEEWCRYEYYLHYKSIRKILESYNVDYLEWNPDLSNGYMEICEFLNIEIPKKEFPHKGKTKAKNNKQNGLQNISNFRNQNLQVHIIKEHLQRNKNKLNEYKTELHKKDANI